MKDHECPVKVPADKMTLDGDLCIPSSARGLVVFSHGSGSSRHSPRNRYVAGELRQAGLATLLIDLLTPDEEADDAFSGNWRFDINLLSRRLTGITDWIHTAKDTRHLNPGLFGASTGAAAALITAALREKVVKAVVSRGGRPDLALPLLDQVKAPTLLIVGGKDIPVIKMNREALVRIKTEKRLVIVPGATHLFEEPGALEQVADLAREWFIRYLTAKNKTKDTEIVR